MLFRSLHVIANSDSEADQALKLRVRDAILAEAEEILTACADLPEAEAQLGAALERMTAIAEATVAQAGYDYEVSAVLSYEVYPTRDYETFRLPAGQYLSLRMTIGAGAGRNWWCVVFPPLCNAATTEEFVKTAEGAGLTAEELALLTVMENLAQLLEGGDPLLKPELLALALPRELMASLYLLVL